MKTPIIFAIDDEPDRVHLIFVETRYIASLHWFRM